MLQRFVPRRGRLSSGAELPLVMGLCGGLDALDG
jgi:hypothetical protein